MVVPPELESLCSQKYVVHLQFYFFFHQLFESFHESLFYSLSNDVLGED
jgi:hypothetical protein